MVWETSDSLLFKFQFTWIILIKRIKEMLNKIFKKSPVFRFTVKAKRDKSGRIRYYFYINGERVHDELTINGYAWGLLPKGEKK